MLDFCGSQQAAYKRTITSPPVEFDWLSWSWVGAEVLVACPNVSRRIYKKECNDAAATQAGQTRNMPKLPDTSSSSRICLLHRAGNIADMATPGNVYQAALTCHATLLNKTEAEVLESIRAYRRLATPPESTRLQYEAQSGMYYDPETELHYDGKTGYFYDAAKAMYYYWSENDQHYMPANTLVQAQAAAAHTAQLAAIKTAAERAVHEAHAAKTAGSQVAAQLAALRAEKDEYASYAYATCVMPQHSAQRWTDETTLSLFQSSGSGIEESLKYMGGSAGGSMNYAASEISIPKLAASSRQDIYPPGCPPPPGV